MRVRHELKICRLSSPIDFSASDLAELTQQLRQGLNSGLFIAPGFEIKHVTDNRHIHIERLEIIAPGNAVMDECEKLNSHSEWFSHLVYYEVRPNEKCYIILRRNSDGKIDAIATNMHLHVFRWLMLLAPKSMAFYPYLAKTDFWLVDQSASYDARCDVGEKKQHKAAIVMDANGVRSDFSIIRAMVSAAKEPIRVNALSVAQLDRINEITVRIKGDLLDHEKTIIEKVTGKAKKIADFAFKRACEKSGYQAKREMFSEPMNDYNQRYVSQQIVSQLEDAKLLNSTEREPKMILFVGEGEARNAFAIQYAYPWHRCYVLEPFYQCIESAKKRINNDRILQMYVEELPARCHAKFDLVFVFNYNIKGNQGDFFEALHRAVKPGGSVVVGRTVADPEYLYSHKTIQDYLKAQFGNYTLGNTEVLKGVLHPDYRFKQVLFVAKKSQTITMAAESATSDDEIFCRMINDLNRAESTKFESLAFEGDLEVINMNNETLNNLDAESNKILADREAAPAANASTSQVKACLFVHDQVVSSSSYNRCLRRNSY